MSTDVLIDVDVEVVVVREVTDLTFVTVCATPMTRVLLRSRVVVRVVVVVLGLSFVVLVTVDRPSVFVLVFVVKNVFEHATLWGLEKAGPRFSRSPSTSSSAASGISAKLLRRRPLSLLA